MKNPKCALYIIASSLLLMLNSLFVLSVNAEYDEYGNYYEPEPYYDDTYTVYDNDEEYVTDSYYDSSDSGYDESSEYQSSIPFAYNPYRETTQYEEDSAEESSEEPESEISVDSSELTSEDWAELQESLNSTFSLNSDVITGSGNGYEKAFKTIKETSGDSKEETNDAWTYLLTGIILIVLGAVTVLIVIITSLRTKKKMKAQAEKYNKRNNREDILSDANIRKKDDE